MTYFIILLILAGLVLIGFLYPYYVKWEIKQRSRPIIYEAREDLVPEIDRHTKLYIEDFYEGTMSYKNTTIINQLTPSSTIFIHNISWDTTTSGYIHTVGNMLYTPIKVRAERVHKTGIIFSSSGKSIMISIDSAGLSKYTVHTATFHPPLVLSDKTTFNLSLFECYFK